MAIALDSPDTVHAGEAITGTVRSSQRVRVFVRRTALWRSAPRFGDLQDHKDRDGVVVNGEGPFVLPAVRGPLTHHGECAELRWSVVAESLDAPHDRAEAPFTLVAPRKATYEREAAGGYRDRPTETTTLEPDFGEQYVEGRPTRVAVPYDPFAAFGAWVVRTFSALTAARAGASDVTLEVTPTRARAGEELVAKLAFTTREEIVVESITIQLAAREYHQQPEGEPLVESHVETITERARLSTGPHAYEARFRVPTGAPPSFATATVGVEWFARATIQVDGQVDVVSDFVIAVAPF